MSSGLRKERGLEPAPIPPPGAMGCPSITKRGSFEALMDVPPRIRMFTPPRNPGVMTWTPATFPWISSSGAVMTPELNSSAPTELITPVTSRSTC